MWGIVLDFGFCRRLLEFVVLTEMEGRSDISEQASRNSVVVKLAGPKDEMV